MMADDVSTAGLNLQKRRLASVHVHSVPHKLMMVRPKQKLNHLRGAVAERVTNSACAVKLEGKSGDKRRMKVIQPNCRVQFTAEDIDFIQAVLGAKAGQGECLVQLLADEECRDLILDDAALFHALLERSGCLRVSSHFYFYVLVRHVLRRAGVEDRAVADYVAEVLAEFSRIDRTRCIIPGQTGTLITSSKCLRRYARPTNEPFLHPGAHREPLAFLSVFRTHPLPDGIAGLSRPKVLRSAGGIQLPPGQRSSPGGALRSRLRLLHFGRALPDHPPSLE